MLGNVDSPLIALEMEAVKDEGARLGLETFNLHVTKAEEIVPARVFSGNRPTTSILAPALTPSVVGQLIALYEHITFTQGIVWGIDSFDQWGVELGKKLALQIAPAVGGDAAALEAQDASTRGLIGRYRALRYGA